VFDFTGFTLFAEDWADYGGVFFLCLIAKGTKTESRTLAATLVAAMLTDGNTATPYVMGVIALVLKYFDSLSVR
jgi:hypothetical protein